MVKNKFAKSSSTARLRDELRGCELHPLLVLTPFLGFPFPVRPSRGGWIGVVFRFKDDVLFFEFRSSTTVWPRATEMDVDAAKALALRINMEVEVRKGASVLACRNALYRC